MIGTNGLTGLGILYISNDKIDVDKTSWELGFRTKFKSGDVKHELALGTQALKVNTYNNGHVGKHLMLPNINMYDLLFTGEIPELKSETYKNQSVDLSSIALVDTMKFANDKIQLTLGARKQSMHQKQYSPVGAMTTDYDKDKVTPLFSILAKPWNDKVSLYASYSEALRAGNVVPNNPLYTNAGQVFEPYVSKQSEFGVKWDNKGLANTLSFYQIKQVNTYQEINGVKRTFHADGEQRNRGIEWMSFGKITDRLRILGGINYSDAKVTKSNANAGKTVWGSPRWTANLGFEWDTSWIKNQDLTLSARLIYNGKQYADSANTMELPSATRFDLGARYRTKIGSAPVTFRASVENLFDRNYWAGNRADSVLFVGTGRTFKLTATFDL